MFGCLTCKTCLMSTSAVCQALANHVEDVNGETYHTKLQHPNCHHSFFTNALIFSLSEHKTLSDDNIRWYEILQNAENCSVVLYRLQKKCVNRNNRDTAGNLPAYINHVAEAMKTAVFVPQQRTERSYGSRTSVTLAPSTTTLFITYWCKFGL